MILNKAERNMAKSITAAAENFKKAYGIRDSGHRREFPTGAVRDMAEGKGRYDLVPWEAIHELALHCEAGAKKYGERNCEKGIPISSLLDSAFRHLSKYMRGADDEPHLRAALWNIAFAIQTELLRPDMQDIPSRLDSDPHTNQQENGGTITND